MAITHSIDPTRGIVTLHYESEPDFTQWQAAMEAVFADPVFRPGMGFLADRRAVLHSPDREYLRSISKYVNRQGERVRGGRWASLVTSPEHYGGAPIGQTFIEGDSIEVAVFLDADAARRWICREPEPGPA